MMSRFVGVPDVDLMSNLSVVLSVTACFEAGGTHFWACQYGVAKGAT
jgi:hypothetical protein